MDALVLVMYVCLAKDIGTAKCFNDELKLQERHIYITDERVSPFQCMMGAQAQIAKWSEEHPTWHIARWKCTPKSRLAQGI